MSVNTKPDMMVPLTESRGFIFIPPGLICFPHAIPTINFSKGIIYVRWRGHRLHGFLLYVNKIVELW
jgi:hypothetical protein